MRHESSVTSVSWIPSEAIPGFARLPVDLGVAHYDSPPPETLQDPAALVGADLARLANELRAWVEVDGGRITGQGYKGRGHINVTTVNLGAMKLAVPAVAFPDLRSEPEVGPDYVRFTQTTGGRTRLPAMLPSLRRPFVRVRFPVVWTTLALTIRVDGSSSYEVLGASPFPRHWFYDSSGTLVKKSGLADFDGWFTRAFGRRNPWSGMNLDAVIKDAETPLERELSAAIMNGTGGRPAVFEVKAADTLVEQGERGQEIFLLLDGVLAVEVDGQKLAEIGPGAVIGERAHQEGGLRTATLRAVTRCRVARTDPSRFRPEHLARLATQHRQEVREADHSPS